MKQLFLLFFLFIKIISFSQTPDNPFAYGKTDSLYSTILQEQRKIFVFNPGAGTNEQLDGKKAYPVIYLFDGEVYFEQVVAMTRELSRIGMIPEVIVVGIPNTDRASDLTPSHLDTPSDVEKAFPRYKTRRRQTGGSERFISFIEKELIPHIDSTYHTTPYRLLIGHSSGALTAINILLNHSDLFHSYIAIDPVTYWNGFKFLKQSEEDLATKKLEGKNLFLTFSNSRNPRTEKIPSDKDTSLLEKTMNFCFQWKDALVRNKQTKLRWDWKYYKMIPMVLFHLFLYTMGCVLFLIFTGCTFLMYIFPMKGNCLHSRPTPFTRHILKKFQSKWDTRFYRLYTKLTIWRTTFYQKKHLKCLINYFR
jgi:predicted alpha/beta superfamily hydrolase